MKKSREPYALWYWCRFIVHVPVCATAGATGNYYMYRATYMYIIYIQHLEIELQGVLALNFILIFT